VRTQPFREISIAEQIRELEDDEPERLNREHGRSSGSSHIGVEGRVVRCLDQKQVELEQWKRERPSGSSYIEDGGNAARVSEYLRTNLVGMVDDRGSGQLEV
jgi:hypothetical protein